MQQIVCASCGATDRHVCTGGKMGGDDLLVANFRRRGWVVDVKREQHKCPDCLDKEIKKVRAAKAEKKESNVTVIHAVPAPTAPASSPSVNSALAKKIASDLLFENYDLGAQDYKPGWDDQRIAKESGLSETFIAQRRSSDYGPCSPPKAAIAKEAAGMAAKVLAMAKDCSSFAHTLDAKLLALTSECERLSGLLADQVKKAV